MELSKDDIHVLQHSLGITDGGKEYRNYYCAVTDDPQLEALTRSGLMVRGHKINDGRNRYYFVTDDGRKVAYKNLPSRPRLTRGQRRYRKWMNISDCYPDLTFKEFLTLPEFREARK